MSLLLKGAHRVAVSPVLTQPPATRVEAGHREHHLSSSQVSSTCKTTCIKAAQSNICLLFGYNPPVCSHRELPASPKVIVGATIYLRVHSSICPYYDHLRPTFAAALSSAVSQEGFIWPRIVPEL